MVKKYAFKNIVMLLISTMMLSGFSCAAAETADITVTNNAVYSDISSAWDSSILIEADLKMSSGTEAYVRVAADDGSEIASVPVGSAAGVDEYASMKLLIHKNTRKCVLYKDNTLVVKGAITGGAAKNYAKLAFVALGGTLNVKNVKVSDYMDTSEKTDELFSSDFTQMTKGARIGTMKAYEGYCDDWYASMPYAGTESSGDNNGWDYYMSGDQKMYYASVIDNSTNWLRFMDKTGSQSLRHMIKDGGVDGSFEINADIFLHSYTYQYDGGFRMFITDENGQAVNLVKIPAPADKSAEKPVDICDGNGNVLFTGENKTIRMQRTAKLIVKVDLDAQLYTVGYSFVAGGVTYSNTSAPIKLTAAVDKAFDFGFAKDGSSESGAIYLQKLSVKAKADPTVGTVLYEEDFNDGTVGDWQFNRTDGHSPVAATVKGYKGHKALFIERSEAKGITKIASAVHENTVYGTLNADGTFTEDTSARNTDAAGGASWATNSAVWYVTLSEPIDTSKNICVEFDAHLGGKSWKYIKSGDNVSYAPRDVMYMTFGSSGAGSEYMAYQYSGGAIELNTVRGTVGEQVIPSVQKQYYDWTQNGPEAEWVTSKVSRKGTEVSFAAESDNYGADVKELTLSSTDAQVDTLAFTINRDNGGACYIDNIRIYEKNENPVETFAAGTTTEIASSFETLGEGIAIRGIGGNLAGGSAVSSVKIGNHTGDLQKSAAVAVALYEKSGDSFVLKDCAVKTDTLSDVENEVQLGKYIMLPEDYTSEKYAVKVFLFDGTDALKPYVPSYTAQ